MSYKLQRNFGQEYYVYRYVENGTGRVLYVGKTNCSLRSRILAHRYEERFQNAPDFHVEYVKLSNSVETDCVEKFLINKWKPPLNIKDKVFGQTSLISLENITWDPYEKYEKSLMNPKTMKKAVDEANKAAVFFHLALQAIDGQFVVPFCSAGIQIEHDGIKEDVAEKEVFPCLGGYRYMLKQGMLSKLAEHQYEIECSIWAPVLNICNMTDNQELSYSVLMQQVDFGEKIDQFAKNGFEDENSLYRFDFRTEYPGGDIYLPFYRVFDDAPKINKQTRQMSGEISSWTYDQEMPLCKKELDKNIVSFAYSLPIVFDSSKMPIE